MFRFQCLAAIARIQGEINMLVAGSKTFCVPMVNYNMFAIPSEIGHYCNTSNNRPLLSPIEASVEDYTWSRNLKKL